MSQTTKLLSFSFLYGNNRTFRCSTKRTFRCSTLRERERREIRNMPLPRPKVG